MSTSCWSPTKALLLRYKALCEEKGSQLMILLFPNLTAHALAEPEYLPYCESLMAFCRENGIPCYNFQYVKADYMENLDAYYYDLYHLNGEGADKFSAFFARFSTLTSAARTWTAGSTQTARNTSLPSIASPTHG